MKESPEPSRMRKEWPPLLDDSDGTPVTVVVMVECVCVGVGWGEIQVPSQGGAFLVWCVHCAAKVSLQRGG